MELKRVVITGLGALTPLGNDVSSFWNGLINGVSGAGPITRFDASKFKTQFACEIKGYNADDHFDRKEGRRIDRYAQYAVIAATEAFLHSGIDVEKMPLMEELGAGPAYDPEANKKLENWTLWILGNIISVPMYFFKEYTFTSIQYIIFTIIAIYGYLEWKKTLNSSPADLKKL